jgi:GDP-L-fucose synthase
MDVSRLHQLGWQAKTDLKTGIEQTYQWFQQHYPSLV